jgi:hypothetical protein
LADNDLRLSQDEFLRLDGDDAAALIAARFDALRELGCDAEAAVVVAVRPEIGVAAAFDLIRRGCDARAAIHILR